MTDGMEGQMSFADLGLWCGKMSPEPCPQTTVKTSDASLRKPLGLPSQMPMCLDLRNGEMWGASWDMDGLLLGEYTMHSFGDNLFPRPMRKRWGGKGVLIQRDRTGAISTVNNQAVIVKE